MVSKCRPTPLAATITLRQLLSHTSGLSCPGFSGYASGPLPSIDQILRAVPPANNERVTVSMLPGTRYAYSGGGYTVIQLVLETVLQKPFRDIMDEVVLKPLGMARSTFAILGPESGQTETDFARAYCNGSVLCSPGHHAQPESAAAGLWTTPSDLLRAVRAVQRSLAADGDGEGFLERERAREMLGEVGENGMALGWRAKKGGDHFQHTGGNDPGWQCIVAGYAELPGGTGDEKEKKREVPTDCGVCIMTNSALGDVAHDKIATAIAYLKGWPSVTDGYVATPFVDHSKAVDGRARDWVGKWSPGAWEIKDENGSLAVSHGASPGFALLPGAVPAHQYEEGTSVDLVADGLAVMLRLGWEKGQKIVEVWQDGDILVLKRESNCHNRAYQGRLENTAAINAHMHQPALQLEVAHLVCKRKLSLRIIRASPNILSRRQDRRGGKIGKREHNSRDHPLFHSKRRRNEIEGTVARLDMINVYGTDQK